MDLEKALRVLIQEFAAQKIEHALVGGLALHFAGYSRSTVDLDLMVLLKDQEAVDQIMGRLGYKRLHKTDNVANYAHPIAALGQVDFLFAHRKYALGMLQRAKPQSLFGNPVKVVAPEDMIGLKVQSSSNDPERAQRDRADIAEILKANRGGLDLNLVREYFRLFGREAELEQTLRELLWA